ncbi:hypothetical protein CDT87_21295, partial [Cronobacter sakazakii]
GQKLGVRTQPVLLLHHKMRKIRAKGEEKQHHAGIEQRENGAEKHKLHDLSQSMGLEPGKEGKKIIEGGDTGIHTVSYLTDA